MTNVIDTLVVELAIDATKLASGEKKVDQSAASIKDKLKKNGEQIESSFASATKAVGEFGEIASASFVAVAASIGLVVDAAKKVYDFADSSREASSQLSVLSRTLDISGTELSTWGNTARLFGGTAAGATSSIASLQGALEDFYLTGQSTVLPYFRALGMSLMDNNGHLKTASELYKELAHNPRLQALAQQDPARAAAILKGIGITDPGMLNAILSGPQAFDEQMALVQKYAPTQADIEAARELTRDHVQLDLAMNKLSATILTDLTPAIDGVMKKMIDFLGWTQHELDHPHVPKSIKPAVSLPGKVFHTSDRPDIDYSWQGFADAVKQVPYAAGVGNFLSDPLGAMRNEDAWLAAKQVQLQYGIPAEVTYAQWALESDHGRHTPPGSNNPFGIKAGAGQPYVEAQTRELIHGRMETVTAKFAKFGSIQAAFDAYGKLLATGPRYAKARESENNPMAFAQALAGMYATDPQYAEKLIQIMRQIGFHDAAGRVTNQTSSQHHETHIGKVEVHTRATDARGIAKDIKPAIENVGMTAQRNYGAQ